MVFAQNYETTTLFQPSRKQVNRMAKKTIPMDPVTAFSFAGVICVVLFNVYEFRRIGRRIEGVVDEVG